MQLKIWRGKILIFVVCLLIQLILRIRALKQPVKLVFSIYHLEYVTKTFSTSNKRDSLKTIKPTNKTKKHNAD